MTTQAKHKQYQSAFSLWLREQKELDSKDGTVISDIDYVITNYRTGKWVMIENKCRNQNVKFPQTKIIEKLHNLCKEDPNYMGYYLLTFSEEDPESGIIFLTNWETKLKRQVTKEQLLYFLKNFKIADQDEVDFWLNF